jgi:hypothetical protein
VRTIEQVIETGRRGRRIYSAHFKDEAIGACQQSGVSIAAVAIKLPEGRRATLA